jgi:hypothetical protein
MHLRVLRGGKGSVVRGDHDQERVRRRRDERPFTGEHLVEHHADGEDVRLRRDRFAHRLLGGHVRRRAREHAGVAILAGVHVQRDAEIEHARSSGGIDDDVARLEVAMDDAVLVRSSRGASDVGRNPYCGARRQRAVGENAEEVGPLDELHRIIRVLVEREADVEDAHDPRITDARRDEGLAHSSSLSIGGWRSVAWTFTATRRSKRCSTASQTTPMPPRPMGRTRS